MKHKVGDIVVCTRVESLEGPWKNYITKGNSYRITGTRYDKTVDNRVRIIDDTNTPRWYIETRFTPISKVRSTKMERIMRAIRRNDKQHIK